MKLSTKIILPIILISALLILLAGCLVTPSEEEPGYTPGTITGIIAAPCCSTSADPVAETSVSPEYWCYYCQETWSLQDGVEVVLTYGEDEIATTTTNENGEFTFTDVPPGKNYVITAYCPDFDDNRPLVKDVALELIEGGSFDTNITDLVSTSLGLVVDFLVLYTEWGPEDISLDEVLADRPNFPSFPKFKKLVLEVRRVVENCEVNLLTDDDVQDALCRAAEEISKLDIGCGPGYTPSPGPGPGPGPTPDPCAGNTAPSVSSVLLDGTPVLIGETVHVIVGTPYVITVNASDDGTRYPLTYSATVDGGSYGPTSSNQITVIPLTVGTYSINLSVYDGCTTTTWGPVTVDVCQPIDHLVLIPTDDTAICVGETVLLSTLIGSVETYAGTLLVGTIDPCSSELTYTFSDSDGEVSFNSVTCEITGVTAGDVDITAEYTLGEDECGTGTTVSSAAVTITVEPTIDHLVLIPTDDTAICVDEEVLLSTFIGSVETYAGTLLMGTIDPCSPELTYIFTTVVGDPGAVSFNPSTCKITGVTAGDVDITVEYTLGEDECGTGTIVSSAAVRITVEPTIDRVVLVEGFNDTICVGETVDFGDLIGSVEIYAGTDLIDTITDLCDPRLAFSFTDTSGEVSFDNTLCPADQPTVTGVTAGYVDITVTYTPAEGECGGDPVPGDAAVTINIDQCADCFILRIKLGGVTHVYTQDYFEPDTRELVPGKLYVVDEDLSSASKFQFMFNCPTGTLEYNYYRGFSCVGTWIAGDNPEEQPDALDPPPVWLTDSGLINGAFYPAKLAQGLKLCQHGGNILKIRVNGESGPVFTFAIGRNPQP